MRPLFTHGLGYCFFDRPTDRVEAVITRLTRHRMMRVGDVLALVQRMAAELNCSRRAVSQAYEKRCGIDGANEMMLFVKGRLFRDILNDERVLAEKDGREYTKVSECSDCGRYCDGYIYKCDHCAAKSWAILNYKEAQKEISEKQAISILRSRGELYDATNVALYIAKTRLRKTRKAIETIAFYQERNYGKT